MFSARQITYSENYFTSRKKILADFLQEEESENLRYIEETENYVSQTKQLLQSLFTSKGDFSKLQQQLEELESALEGDTNLLQGEIKLLQIKDKRIEEEANRIQKEEEKSNQSFQKQIEKMKNELESKEFSIQNMEKLCIQLENIIKENINNGSEQLLTMEQFDDFISQNDKLKKEISQLEEEKNKLEQDYYLLLKENLELRQKEENFDLDEMAEEINKNKESEVKEENKENKETEDNLIKECLELKGKILKVLFKLKGIDCAGSKVEDFFTRMEYEVKNGFGLTNKLSRGRSKSYVVKNKDIFEKKYGYEE